MQQDEQEEGGGKVLAAEEEERIRDRNRGNAQEDALRNCIPWTRV
jgi:hypothetical protein